MSQSTDNLVLEMLRAIRSTQEKQSHDLLEIKERIGFVEQQYASISRRVDRIDERLDRVDRRLGLIEA
jgi:hypothetical protein